MVSDTHTQRYSSLLLSPEENDQVIRLLGERCQHLVMSVVQVFQTAAPDHGSWRKRDAGVLVLVKDNCRRSYFFRLYCLTRRQLVWEHEVYSNMEYNTPKPFFHMFEAEDCVTAFNFADDREAVTLDKVLKENMAARQKRRQERERKKQASQSTTAGNHLSSQHSVSTPQLSNGSIQVSAHHRATKGKDKRRQAEKKKFTKADIGSPQDFRHVSHVGWNPNTGFDFDEGDCALKEFLAKAGVSESQLQDKNTRDFIYGFINDNGGIDRVKSEVQVPDVPPPPVPARSAPTNASIRTAPPPPPPPSRTQLPPPLPPSQAPVAVSTPRPPPPPPLRTLPQRQDSAKGAPTPPAPPPPPPMQMGASSPAPPPPPPPGAAPAAPLPPAAPAAPAVPDLRSALMDAIRSGKALKPVSQEEKSRNGNVGDSRSELMDQIRQGKELKAVSTSSQSASGSVGDVNIIVEQECLDSLISSQSYPICDNDIQQINITQSITSSDISVVEHCDQTSFSSSSCIHFSDYDRDQFDSPSVSTCEHTYVNISNCRNSLLNIEQMSDKMEDNYVSDSQKPNNINESVHYSWSVPKKTPIALKFLKYVLYFFMQIGVLWLFHWNLLFLFPYPTSIIVLIMSLGVLCALLLSLSLVPNCCFY